MAEATVAIAVIGLALGLYTAWFPLRKMVSSMNKLDKSHETVCKNMDSLGYTLSILQRRVERSEILHEAGLIISNMANMLWESFELMVQRVASYHHNSEYLIRQVSDAKFELTETGKEVLDPQLRSSIAIIRKNRQQISHKDIILELGVQALVKDALSRAIPPDVMIGVIITYLQNN